MIFAANRWVLIPGILCWESGKKIVGACEQSKVETNRKNEQLGISDNVSSDRMLCSQFTFPLLSFSKYATQWYYLSAATLVVYVVLIPVVLHFSDLVDQ